MALVQTCKCEECGMQKSFANHWVMVLERAGSLVVLAAWDEKKIRSTRHFCGRAHASRYVERWMANPGAAPVPDAVVDAESNRSRGFAPNYGGDAERRQAEQRLKEDEFGDEISSARVVPTPISVKCA